MTTHPLHATSPANRYTEIRPGSAQQDKPLETRGRDSRTSRPRRIRHRHPRRPATSGFANWAVETEAQEAELDTFFDSIIVCTVTGSSHAGMIAGFSLSDRPGRRVIGIDASGTLEQIVDQLARIATNTTESIGLDRPLRDNEITVISGYAGFPGLGSPERELSPWKHHSAGGASSRWRHERMRQQGEALCPRVDFN